MTHRIRVYGIVQGVGFRPAAARLAEAFGIRGTVSNRGPYVEIIAEAERDALEKFEAAIRNDPPDRAVILKMEVTETGGREFSGFSIAESEKTKGEILIPPDIAVCEACRRELYDKGGRRYLHPFINCTSCGPRLTILEALPYDRIRTSMKAFPMCRSCGKEYTDPADRRYDAQPVCCNACGPVVYLLETNGMPPRSDGGRRYRSLSGLSQEALQTVRTEQKAAITQIRRTIAEGGIAAVKGIGGYHLCCDAGNEEAVKRLREKKGRPGKPFAVMARDMAAVRKYCRVSRAEETILTGPQKPIVLLKKRDDCLLAMSVAPDNPKAGVMLPYAPLQLLLFDYPDGIRMPDALVMTSANVSGAPICRDEKEAAETLSAICDEILAHNRMIRVRADDSVMDLYRDTPYMIRRSRGYAPLPVRTEKLTARTGGNPKTVLAIGGELKNAFCIRVGELSYLSPYVGDAGDLRTIEVLKETAERFLTLLEAAPEAVICDLHPGYSTSCLAEELAGELKVPLYRIQHHYAHVLSCIAENDAPDPVIGIALDGTGYGEDGSIWGGEILIADTERYERAGFLKPFRQTGGDVAAREGWRIAVSMIDGLCRKKYQGDPERALKETLETIRNLGLCGEKEAEVLCRMAETGLNTVRSTSCGRLFDAVSAVLGIRRVSTFEGEASAALQTAAERGRTSPQAAQGYAVPAVEEENGFLILPSDRIFSDLLEKRAAGEETDFLAFQFHKALAELLAAACGTLRARKNINKVALTGGCFQNTLLLELTETRLREEGFTVLRHHLVPPNDNGLALGQAVWGGFPVPGTGPSCRGLPVPGTEPSCRE